MNLLNLENITLFTNDNIELAPLTIITGVNNSGKTLILNTIRDQFENTKRYKWLGLSIFTNNFINNKNEILLLNQPEAGLHPKLQLEMADVLLNYIKNGKNIVIETHSDHFINRIVRRYTEDETIRNKIKLYFINKKDNEISTIENIQIDEFRGTKCENKDFFYQYTLEIENILIAEMNNMKQKNK